MFSFNENGYLIKQLDTDQITAAQRFRYEIVVKELGWVESDTGLESDQYDRAAICFGVYKNDELIGFSRLVPDSDLGFMTFNEFDSLIGTRPDVDLKEAADISRLIVSPRYRDLRSYFAIVKSLYRIMYLWSTTNRIRYWFFVAYDKELAALRDFHHFPIETLGGGQRFSDNGLVFGCFLDLVEAEKNLAKVSPKELAWYTNNLESCFSKP